MEKKFDIDKAIDELLKEETSSNPPRPKKGKKKLQESDLSDALETLDNDPDSSELFQILDDLEIVNVYREPGWDDLNEIVGILDSDYRDFGYFIQDNPGVSAAIIEFIMDAMDRSHLTHWKENMIERIREEIAIKQEEDKEGEVGGED